MPSSLQAVYRALKNRMGDTVASDSKESVTPLDSAWSKVLTILSVMNNAHVSVDGNPPVMKLVDGQHPNKETVNEKPVTLCYFSHRIDDVTYYVTSRGNAVALPSFPDEPDVNTRDVRLFVIEQNPVLSLRVLGQICIYLMTRLGSICRRREVQTEIHSTLTS